MWVRMPMRHILENYILSDTNSTETCYYFRCSGYLFTFITHWLAKGIPLKKVFEIKKEIPHNAFFDPLVNYRNNKSLVLIS